MTLVFHIPSRSKKRKGIIYNVTRLNSGEWLCDCMAFTFNVNRNQLNKTCKHIMTTQIKLWQIMQHKLEHEMMGDDETDLPSYTNIDKGELWQRITFGHTQL